MSVFDYFYGTESEMFTFYRIPKQLFTDQRFVSLSDSAKVLYGLMLDRLSLSQKNGWIDDQNRVYIIYAHEQIINQLHYSKNTVTKLLSEIDEKNGIGLIERIRRGLGKPDIIFVKNFNSVLESPENKASFQNPKKWESGIPKGGADTSLDEIMQPNSVNMRMPQKNNPCNKYT